MERGGKVQEIKTVKAMVERVLEEIPSTRNSDKELTIQLWQIFFSEHIFYERGEKACIRLESIWDLPSQDSIKRVRAEIQNVEKRLIPTDPEVAEARGWLMDDWKKALGYYVEDSGQGKFSFAGGE